MGNQQTVSYSTIQIMSVLIQHEHQASRLALSARAAHLEVRVFIGSGIAV